MAFESGLRAAFSCQDDGDSHLAVGRDQRVVHVAVHDDVVDLAQGATWNGEAVLNFSGEASTTVRLDAALSARFTHASS